MVQVIFTFLVQALVRLKSSSVSRHNETIQCNKLLYTAYLLRFFTYHMQDASGDVAYRKLCM